ncbi:hypothetical protein V8G57_12225 [Collimonas sp. H4R21]|jgi:hypothetical protein|uniref:MYXO-CTERM domain-containing protein n=1 Tax=Collimonas rhizosphaerae TaxID=3126357 RepID=A0ABU9PVV8_9BURK|nr:hypothetical protein [Collimonas sp. OK412]SFC88401.1 hypothetical protein SAMN04515619_11563 [Collimonas sp. OK412]
MLRLLLLGFAVLLALAGLVGVIAGADGAWPFAFWGLLLAAAVLLERWRYAHAPKPDDGPWQETGERFVDPESGRVMSVWYSPDSGERRYVPVSENDSRLP